MFSGWTLGTSPFLCALQEDEWSMQSHASTELGCGGCSPGSECPWSWSLPQCPPHYRTPGRTSCSYLKGENKLQWLHLACFCNPVHHHSKHSLSFAYQQWWNLLFPLSEEWIFHTWKCKPLVSARSLRWQGHSCPLGIPKGKADMVSKHKQRDRLDPLSADVTRGFNRILFPSALPSRTLSLWRNLEVWTVTCNDGSGWTTAWKWLSVCQESDVSSPARGRGWSRGMVAMETWRLTLHLMLQQTLLCPSGNGTGDVQTVV